MGDLSHIRFLLNELQMHFDDDLVVTRGTATASSTNNTLFQRMSQDAELCNAFETYLQHELEMKKEKEIVQKGKEKKEIAKNKKKERVEKGKNQKKIVKKPAKQMAGPKERI